MKNKMKTYHLITANLSSRVAESYRVLRTNIQFASLDKPIRTILMTSTAPSEGKSTTCANLAIAFAQTGSKVLIIDADLRRPSTHKVFGLSNQVGLTSLVMQAVSPQLAMRDVGVPNLRVITAGPIPPNPAEMLGSARMRAVLKELAAEYDYVLLDSPPTLAVTDSSVLATLVDGVVLVVAAGEVSADKVLKAKHQLAGVQANILGVVLNGVELEAGEDHYYYYYGARKEGD